MLKPPFRASSATFTVPLSCIVSDSDFSVVHHIFKVQLTYALVKAGQLYLSDLYCRWALGTDRLVLERATAGSRFGEVEVRFFEAPSRRFRDGPESVILGFVVFRDLPIDYEIHILHRESAVSLLY